MKKVLAGFLIALFTLMNFAGPYHLQQHPPQSAAEAIGNMVGLVLDIGFLFFSVRWYIMLSGHTYKVNRQAWAVILFWYSVLATLVGLVMIFAVSVALGAPLVLLWSGVGFACWKWRQRLRRAESLTALPATAEVKA